VRRGSGNAQIGAQQKTKPGATSAGLGEDRGRPSRRLRGVCLDLRNDAVHFGEQPFSRRGVMDLLPRADLPVTVEPFENV
jgi:hypothetical protein